MHPACWATLKKESQKRRCGAKSRTYVVPGAASAALVLLLLRAGRLGSSDLARADQVTLGTSRNAVGGITTRLQRRSRAALLSADLMAMLTLLK